MLPYTACYENSRGETLRFDCAPCLLTGGTLFDSGWKLTTARSPLGEGERLLRGRRPCETRTLLLDAAATSPRELADLLERVADVTEYDLHSGEAGKLWVNGQYLSCWCVSSEKRLSCSFPSSARVTLKVYPQTPVWCTERIYRFTADNSDDVTGHRYPFAYPRRYGTGNRELVMNNRYIAPAPMRVVFYGPAVNPRILVGSIDVGVLTTLTDGQYAVVDQITREVWSVDSDGAKTNCFDLRRKTGTTFQPAPSGSSTVQLVSGGRVDITMFEQRSEPRWTPA